MQLLWHISLNVVKRSSGVPYQRSKNITQSKHSKISWLYETTVGIHHVESGFISSCLHLISFVHEPREECSSFLEPQDNFVLVKELLLSSNLLFYTMYSLTFPFQYVKQSLEELWIFLVSTVILMLKLVRALFHFPKKVTDSDPVIYFPFFATRNLLPMITWRN